MEFKKMESFTALCELKNFTKAADYLYLAQSSLSTQIKSLEEELGYKLVSRDNKKEVVLTKEGEIFLDFCRRCLSLYDQLQDSLDKSSKSTIKNIGLFYNPRLEMWADKISYHNTDCPNDKYGIVFSYGRERVEQMLKNEFFIAFSRRNPIFEANGFTFSHSYDSCFALGVSYDHPLSNLNEAVPDDFRNYTIYTIDPKRTNADIKLINLMVSKYDLDRRNFKHLSRIGDLHYAVKTDKAIIMMPKELLPKDAKAIELKFDDACKLEYGWYYREMNDDVRWVIENL